MLKKVRGDKLRFLDEALKWFKNYHYPYREHEILAGRLAGVETAYQWVRSTREARLLSLEVVAERAEVAASTLARIERNETRANIQTLMKLAEALDCEFVYGFRPKRSIAKEVFEKLVPFVRQRENETPAVYAIRVSTQLQSPRVRKQLGWTTVKGGYDRILRPYF